MKYRKKPVVIEAEPFDPQRLPLPFSRRGDPCCLDGERWYIATLEGDHNLTVGDMVIRGVKGEFYPCKPDIFEATHDAADRALDAEALLEECEDWLTRFNKPAWVAPPSIDRLNDLLQRLRARKQGEQRS